MLLYFYIDQSLTVDKSYKDIGPLVKQGFSFPAVAILIEDHLLAILPADGIIRLSFLEGNLVSTSLSPPMVLTGKWEATNPNQE